MFDLKIESIEKEIKFNNLRTFRDDYFGRGVIISNKPQRALPDHNYQLIIFKECFLITYIHTISIILRVNIKILALILNFIVYDYENPA